MIHLAELLGARTFGKVLAALENAEPQQDNGTLRDPLYPHLCLGRKAGRSRGARGQAAKALRSASVTSTVRPGSARGATAAVCRVKHVTSAAWPPRPLRYVGAWHRGTDHWGRDVGCGESRRERHGAVEGKGRRVKEGACLGLSQQRSARKAAPATSSSVGRTYDGPVVGSFSSSRCSASTVADPRLSCGADAHVSRETMTPP